MGPKALSWGRAGLLPFLGHVPFLETAAASTQDLDVAGGLARADGRRAPLLALAPGFPRRSLFRASPRRLRRAARLRDGGARPPGVSQARGDPVDARAGKTRVAQGLRQLPRVMGLSAQAGGKTGGRLSAKAQTGMGRLLPSSRGPAASQAGPQAHGTQRGGSGRGGSPGGQGARGRQGNFFGPRAY